MCGLKTSVENILFIDEQSEDTCGKTLCISMGDIKTTVKNIECLPMGGPIHKYGKYILSFYVRSKDSCGNYILSMGDLKKTKEIYSV